MCGRYSLDLKPNSALNGIVAPSDVFKTPRYNVGPGQNVPVLTATGWIEARFGLVPQWAKDAKVGYSMINARSETLPEKRTYSGLLKAHRCLVPASGFFEWDKTEEGKVPYYFTVKNAPIIAFAGLWTERKDAEDFPVRSFTIITAEANTLLAKIHDRMPVILDTKAQQEWMNQDSADLADLMSLLGPYPSDKMEMRRVSTEVNKVGNDRPDLLNSV